MIGYVTLGTNDLQRAAKFYDPLLALLGAQRVMSFETFISWGNGPAGTALSIVKPFDRQTATHGNGTMVALAGGNQETVDKVYQKAIELGAKDEGPAGPRHGNFYGGYFRDLDGNKLCVFCVT